MIANFRFPIADWCFANRNSEFDSAFKSEIDNRKSTMSRILLVEDSKVQALVMQQLLESAGYTVEHVPTVEDALCSLVLSRGSTMECRVRPQIVGHEDTLRK